MSHRPPEPCEVGCEASRAATDKWYRDRREAEELRYNPSRFRPDIIKRLWSHVHADGGDPGEWNGNMRRAASPDMSSAAMRVARGDGAPEAVVYDTVDYRYGSYAYDTYVVEFVEAEGIRVWARITKR